MLDNINFKLKEFYYPIYSNLLRENIIWGKLICISESNKQQDEKEIVLELDSEILRIHLIAQKIIQDNIIVVNPKKELLELLMKYDEHVTVFNSLRSIGNMEYPSAYNSPYPRGLFEMITQEMEELKKKHKEILDDDDCNNQCDPKSSSSCCFGCGGCKKCSCESQV
jgi:hypothetical protein